MIQEGAKQYWFHFNNLYLNGSTNPFRIPKLVYFRQLDSKLLHLFIKIVKKKQTDVPY